MKKDAELTMRDHFAAKAMEGLLACPDSNFETFDELSRHCYCMADAMLKARTMKKEDL